MISTDEQSQQSGIPLRSRRIFAAAVVAAALSLPSLSLSADAETISWTGAADGNWFNAANWSPAQVPASADDVVIDANTTVSVSGATSIAFATLVLGDAAGNFAPTLRLSAVQSTGGAVTIHRGAKLQQDTNQQIVFGALNVMPGGMLSHTANSSARSFLINLAVSGDFDLQAGATIAASGLGYAGGVGPVGGSGPGGGASNNVGAGGAHGGAGGNSNGGAAGGAAYDSATNPLDLGSGGGGSYTTGRGGAGGGAVLIAVGGTFSLNGEINANGAVGTPSQYNYGVGGGAGGTVNIIATSLNGAGQVLANGGAGFAGGNFGGGGGGGRIAVVVTGNDASSLMLQAGSGAGAGGATSGGTGVIARKGPVASLYSLTIGEPSVTPQSITPVAGASPVFATVTISNGIVNFDAGSTVTIGGLVITGTAAVTAAKLAPSTLEVASGAVLQLNAQATSGSLQVNTGGMFRQMNAVPLSFTSVSILPGGALTHAANSTARSSVVNLNVSGNFDLQAGAVIAANGLGYAGGVGQQNGFGPGPGTSNAVGGGGAHGGAGGVSNNGAAGGAAYDSATNPVDLGSGGGGSYTTGRGGAGGGAVLIAVGGAFSLNGQINANGAVGTPSQYNYGVGGGAGGAVNITATALNGAGQVLANGGAGFAGGNFGGGGGGGRIAVVVSGSDASNLNLQANGGVGGGAGATSGGAGVIALKTSGGINYNLTIGDPSYTPQSVTAIAGSTPTFSTATLNNSIVSFDAGSTVTINNLVVSGVVSLTAAALSINGGVIHIKNGGILRLTAQSISGGHMLVDGGGSFQQMNTLPLGFASVLVLPGGLLTHAPNTSTRSSVLNLAVSGDFDLQAGATIAANGLGYAGGVGQQNGFGPGPGTSNAVGGGGAHGGAGGVSNNGAAGGAAYDSATNPVELGSGGGGSYTTGRGGAGGGAVLIAVGGAFSLNGQINANGAVGTPSQFNYGVGGGAGGTVNITATAFNGEGSVLANGGAGFMGANFGGGGGGGRIAVVVSGTDASSLNLQANGGAGGGGATSGGAGVIALKTTGGTNYSLSIGDLTAVPQSGSGVGGTTPEFSTVTLNNSIVNFDPGSNVTINSLVVVGGAALSGHNFSFGSASPIQVRSGGSLKVTANQLTVPVGSSIEIQGGGSLAFAVGGNSGGALIVREGGIFQQLNAQILNFDSVLVEPGGLLTHAANSSTRSSFLNLAVGGDFDLQAGAVIEANGLGYAGGVGQQNGFGPGPGTSNAVGGGGAHGGAGGVSNNGAAGGAAYDSATNPVDLGSGGGGSYTTGRGGAGGGAVRISVGGTFSLNGEIKANGAVGTPSQFNYGVGGGAGGAVNITATALNGAGQVLANGGAGFAGSNFGGGGGGGRIAVVVTGNDASSLTLQAGSGAGAGGATSGGTGVIARKGPVASLYSLTIGEPSVTPQSITPVAGALPVFATVTISNGIVNFDAGSTVTIGGLVITGTAAVTAARLTPSTLEVASGAVLQLNAQATSGNLQVNAGGVFRQMNTASLNFDSVSILTGGALTHAANSTSRSSVINLNVSGNFDLQTGAAIAAAGLGYAGGVGQQNGFGPGPGVYNGIGGGGAHGGAGGAGSNGAPGGAAYDSATNPIDLGSGGGGSYSNGIGGSGGGAVLITVGGAFSLNGQINANGGKGTASAQTYGTGGGAGGTVNITASAFNGAGSILAGGAAGVTGGNYGGGGGGGIVALTGCNSDLVPSAVNGGAAGGPGATAGGAGAITPVIPGACPNAPPPPENLAVTSMGQDASGSTFITATWDPAAQALSYVLQASTDSNFAGTVFVATSTVTTATVRGLTPNAAYFLAVKAFNDIGFSNFSAAVSTLTPADLTAPQAPSLMSASGRPAGAVALSWQPSASGEVAAFYNVYRATEDFASIAGLTPTLAHLSTTSASDLPPEDGTYFYGVTALDPSGNESPLSNRLSAASIHFPNAPISDLTATFLLEQKQIVLNWGEPSAGTPVSYVVYRTTFAASVVSPQDRLQSLDSLTFTDQPSLSVDATYYYRVTSLNAVSEESAPSNAAASVFDVHAPVIGFSGIADGQSTRFDVAPVVAIADFSPVVSTLTLNGQPFVASTTITGTFNQTVGEGGTASLSCSAGTILSFTSVWATSCGNPKNCGTCPLGGASCTVLYNNAQCGDVAPGCSKDGRLAITCGYRTTLTEPGAYTLSLEAQDAFAHASSATIRFTIDKSSPVIVLTFPADGALLNANATVAYSLFDDFTATGSLIVRNGANQPPPFVFTSEGLNAVSLTATDLAGNVGTATSTFTLDKTPPTGVTDLHIGDVREGEVDLLWTAPSDALSGVAGYLVRLATYPITAGNFLAIPASQAPAVQPSGTAILQTVAGDTSNTLYFAVRSTDAAGNLSALSNPVFLDTDPPLITAVSPALGATVSRPTRITVSATDLSGVASVVFTIDGVAVATRTAAPYEYDWATIPLADGEHTIELRATDAVGNSVVLPGFYTLHYAPPASPVVTSPASGFSTFVATVTVTGSVEPGTTAQVRVNGVPSGSAYAPSGSFSAQAVLPVEGDYQLTVVATDAKGQSSPSASRTVFYNLAPPNPPAAFSAETLAAGKVHLSWDVPGGKAPVSYRLYRSASPTALSPGVTPGSSLRVASGLTTTVYDDTPSSDGVYYYGGTSLDSSGNESGLSEVASALSDRVAPSAALALGTGTVTAGQHPLTVTLTKPLASVPILLFVANGAGPQAVSLSASSPTVWTGTLTVTGATAYGPAAFQFQGTDFAGNAGTTITSGRTLFVDNRGPIGAVTLFPFPPLKAGDADLALVLDEPAASTPSLAFVTAAGTTVTVALEGAGTTWVSTFAVPSGADGTAVFHYAAADALGNAGTTLSSGGNFAIDATPAGAPLSLSAVSRPAGVIRLSWSGPIGEAAAAYRVYRDSAALPGTVIPAGDQTGHLDDLPPAEGTYTYETASIDAAGNESARSNAAGALSDATLPSAPAGSTATINAFGRAEVSWSTLAGEAYRVRRATYAAASYALAPFVVVSPPYVDTPPLNGLIYYAIEALDAAGNVSASASVATVFFDRAPPLITITGVAEGGLYNAPVFPVYSASDPALDEGSVAALLNGASFVSGSAVSGEGDYTLQVTAANLAAISSTVTVHFSLDRSSPAIAVAGVVTGQAYQQAVIPLVTVTDPRLASVVLTLNGAAYAAGTPVSADGAYSLVVTGRDLAGNVASSTTTFTLDLPPAAPPGFSVAIEEGLGATLTWQNPAADVAGYRVYRDGVPLHQGLLSQALLSDPAFVLGSARLYEVAAVDAAGQEGARAKATIPAATVVLESFGSVDGGAAYLTRGFFDAVRVRLANSSASSKLLGPTSLTFLSNGVPSTSGSAPSVTVPAGGQLTSEGVLITPLSLSDSAAVRATVSLPVEPGASATMRRTFPVAARDPREPILEVFSGALVRGANANVQVKVNNQGSAPLQVLSAVPSDLLVELRTPEGTVLSSSRLSQTGNGAAASPSGWFVAVPGGSSVMLDPVAVFVPDSVGVSAQIRARVDRVFTSLVSGGVQGPRSFETVKTLSGVEAPPYRATVRPQQPLYDQGSSILLVGEALDQEDALVAGATVQIGVSLRGFERLASTRTDETGHYQLAFAPTPSEAGAYTLWAAHPSVVDRAPQSSFTVVGLAYQFSDYTTRLTQNSATAFRVNLTNSGQTRIEGLSASVISSAVLSGASLTLDAASLPVALDAGQSASLSFTGSATGAAALGRSRFAVRVTESHGFVRELPVNVDVAAALPVPSAVPQAFNVGVRAGQTRRLETRLKNLGNRDWQGVTLSAPALSWARIDGPTALGDIPPGGEKLVAIVLEPPTGLPSQAYASNPLVTVSALNAASVPLNTLITVTASGEGNVAYTVIDADKPRNAFGVGVSIPGAEATLVSLDVAGLSFRATADSNGLARVLSVPQGRYSYTVRASGYEDRTGTELIEPGVTLAKEIILPTNVVTYEWTVEPTTIQDKYDITLGITFKTDVPAPVVSVEPAVLNFALEGGQSADAQLTFENKGLITATNVRVKPNIVDPAVTVDFPFDEIPELRPGQKVTVPFRIGLIHASCHPLDIGVDYRYIAACGIEAQKALPTVKITAGTCFNLPTVGVGGGSGGGFSSTPQTSGGSGGISLSVPASYISFAMPQPPPPSGGAQVCRSPKIKYPSECNNCDQIGSYSNPGGDPRVPESDLSLSVPKFGGSLDFTRVYDSEDFDVTALGKGWTHSFAARISMFPVGVIYFPRRLDIAGGGSSVGQMEYTGISGALLRNDAGVGPFGIKAEDYAELRTPSGRRLLFRHTGNGQFTSPVGEPSTLVLDTATASGYTWTMPDKTVYRFSAGGRLDTIQDRNGNTVTLGYDASGLTTVRDPDNRVLYTFANSGGKLQSVTDLAGRVVTYGYNGQGQLSSASGPKGNTSYGYSSYEIPDLDENGFANGIFGAYNAVSLMTSVTSPNGHVTSFTYGPANKVVDYPQMPMFQAIQASGGGTGSFAIGDAGFGAAPITVGFATPPADKAYFTALVPVGSSYVVDTARFAQWFFSQRLLTTGESGPMGNYTFSHTIDELIEGGRTVVTDPRGFTETRTWENLGGRTQSTDIIDPAGGVTKITFDANRNPTGVIDRAGRTNSVVYDSRSNPTRITNALGQSINLSYDPSFNLLTSITDAKGQQATLSYNPTGDLTGISRGGGTIQVAPNANGLINSVVDESGVTLQIQRDSIGRPTAFNDGLNRSTSLEYNDAGDIVAIIDALNRRTEIQRNSDGSIAKVTDPNLGATTFSYDPGTLDVGRLLRQIQDAKGNLVRFTYDSRGRPLTSANGLNQSRTFAHDNANNLTSEVDELGRTTSHFYDSRGRLERTQRVDGDVNYTYDAADNLVAIEDVSSRLEYGYDAAGRVVTVRQVDKVANLTTTISYTYDANDNRGALTLAASPAPLVFNYVHDDKDRLKGIQDPFGRNYSFSYDSKGRRTRLSYPNGVESNYSYDNANQLSRLEHRRISDSNILGFTEYHYNAVGDKTQKTGETGVHLYEYDSLRRLTRAEHPLTSTHSATVETFQYDSVGNRTADALASGYQYDAANRLLENSPKIFAHNAAGERTSQTEKSSNAQTRYYYDSRNRLTRVERPDGAVITHRYDAIGRRLEKTIVQSSGTVIQRFIYDGNDVLAVVNGENQLDSLFTHGYRENEPMSVRSMTNNVDYFIHQDGVGSVTLHTTTGALVAERISYDIFGRPYYSAVSPIPSISTRSITASPFAFSARAWDDESGLYLLGRRYYDPDSGRFITEDPLNIAGGHNQYLYGDNNPNTFMDADGRIPILIVIGAVWAAVEIVGAIYDLYAFLDAISDPCATNGDVMLASGGLALSILAPGSGYGGAAKYLNQRRHWLAKSGKIVIGGRDDYVRVADQLGAHRFALPDEVWKKMAKNNTLEAANFKFLDRAIARGDEIILATPRNKRVIGGGYDKELDYLIGKGYRPSPDGTRMIK